MIKAVIFDCFGVLTTDAWLPFKRRYFGTNAELEKQATDLNKMVDAGLADYDDFIASVAHMAGIPVSRARTEIENNVPNEQLFAYIQTELKPNYKIGLLSNAGANWLHDLFAPEQTRLFDQVGLSCETGYLKPHQQAYQDIAGKLGVEPEECIFVDDQARYCSAAADAGMKGVLYTDFEQSRRDIEALLGKGF